MSKPLNPIALAGGEQWTPAEAAELRQPPGSEFTCPHCAQILQLHQSYDNHSGFPRWEHQSGDGEYCRAIRARKRGRETWLPVGAVWPAGRAEDPE